MRLLSYNIHKGIGGRDRRYDIQRVIEVIEEENPDLICLQEVDHHVRRITVSRPAAHAGPATSAPWLTCGRRTCGSRRAATAT